MIVGGGNSAGQAAVYPHNFARKVWMLVRGPSLVSSMLRYLINRIAAMDNIEVLTNAQIIALSGTPHARIRRSRTRRSRRAGFAVRRRYCAWSQIGRCSLRRPSPELLVQPALRSRSFTSSNSASTTSGLPVSLGPSDCCA